MSANTPQRPGLSDSNMVATRGSAIGTSSWLRRTFDQNASSIRQRLIQTFTPHGKTRHEDPQEITVDFSETGDERAFSPASTSTSRPTAPSPPTVPNGTHGAQSSAIVQCQDTHHVVLTNNLNAHVGHEKPGLQPIMPVDEVVYTNRQDDK